MRLPATATIVIIAALALACSSRHGIRGNAVGPAWLDTVYLRHGVAVVHLLFVADAAAPGQHVVWSGGGSVGSWNAELRRNYTDPATHTRIDAPPIVIRGTTLRAGRKPCDLTRGNVLVVHVSPSGSLRVTQLPHRRGADEPAQTIVPFIKSALPKDARVQALPLR
jgi:hypothetical protein